MVLVDTSVWVKFFAGRRPYFEQLRGLLLDGQVAAHDYIYGELLIGDPGGGRNLLRQFQHIVYLKTISHPAVIELVQDRKLHGRGVGWIDVHLLASALSERIPLWAVDESLRDLAEEFGIGYRPH